MNSQSYDMFENIHEKYISALQLHTGLSEQDLGAANLAIGMALGDLDAAWQRRYDVLAVEVDALMHDNARLAEKVAAITAQTVTTWRNGDSSHAAAISFAPLPVTTDAPIVIVEAAAQLAAIAAAADTEADDGNAPLTVAPLDDDDDDEEPPFRFRWQGLPDYALSAIADMELGTRSWRAFPTETRRLITLTAIREMQAAQYDGHDLTTTEYNRSKPEWMPNYSTLFATLAMTWKQMLEAATATA